MNLLGWLDDWPGGTNPYPDPPTMTPDDSTGPSVGPDGNWTGPIDKNVKKIPSILIQITFTNANLNRNIFLSVLYSKTGFTYPIKHIYVSPSCN